MSGYTHLQPSEPITFAHYCAGMLEALERSYWRIERRWDALNLLSLGWRLHGIYDLHDQ